MLVEAMCRINVAKRKGKEKKKGGKSSCNLDVSPCCLSFCNV